MTSTLPHAWLCRLLLVAFALCAAGTLRASAEEGARAIRCEAYCNPKERRAPGIRVYWEGAGVPKGARTFALGPDAAEVSEKVEVTAYSNGFTTKRYVILDAGTTRTESSLALALPEGGRPLPGLELKVAGVRKPGSSLSTPQAVPDGEQKESARRLLESVMEVEGLDAGMQYEFRVRISGQGQEHVTSAVRCRAPVCTSDGRRKDR